MWEFHLGIQIFRVAVDENEGVVKAQNSRGVVFASRSCQSRAEDQSSETLTVNQLSANRPLLLQIWSLVPSRGSSKKVERCPTVRKCKTGTRPGPVV